MNPIQAVARRRLVAIGAVALIAWVLVAARLVDVAILERPHWVAEARKQQERAVRLLPERGSLLDARGRELAVSAPAWSAWADPSALDDPAGRREAARALARALDVPGAALVRRLSQDREFVWLRRGLAPAARDRVAALGIPGIAFVKESRRLHPLGELASDVLGFVGTDQVGLAGLEHSLQPQIGGAPGLLLTMRDARGDDFLPGGLSLQPAQRGADVVLTLDAVVQHVAERELKAALARTGARAGTVIVMFPSTGEVLALSNQPSIESNNTPSHPSHLRTNRAVASCYEPGSTLKMFTAAAALESGVRPQEIFDCENGSIRIGRARIRDHQPFGLLPVPEILALSSNVGAIKLGQRAGAAGLHDLLRRVGFGARTGIECPGESAGVLADARQWSPRSLASVSFGQEIAVSPIQLVTAACAIACEGMLPAPTIVKAVRSTALGPERARPGTEMTRGTAAWQEGARRAAPPTVAGEQATAASQRLPEAAPREARRRPPAGSPQRVMAPHVAVAVNRMLEGVVDHGTGRSAAVPGYRVAGKTGTAQKIGPDGAYLEDAFVASFVGWIPSRKPVIAVLVVLDEPRGAYHGGDVAAPVFAAIARDVLRYLEIPPETPGHVLELDAARSEAPAGTARTGAGRHA